MSNVAGCLGAPGEVASCSDELGEDDFAELEERTCLEQQVAEVGVPLNHLVIELVLSQDDTDNFGAVGDYLFVTNELNELQNEGCAIVDHEKLLNTTWMADTTCDAADGVLDIDWEFDTVWIRLLVGALDVGGQLQQTDQSTHSLHIQCFLQVHVVYQKRLQNREQDGQTRNRLFITVELVGMINEINHCNHGV